MARFNIHKAKKHLLRLIESAAKGEGFLIAKAGKPLVKVVPIAPSDRGSEARLGFLAGEIAVPEDFDSMGKGEIEALFAGRGR